MKTQDKKEDSGIAINAINSMIKAKNSINHLCESYINENLENNNIIDELNILSKQINNVLNKYFI